MIATLTSRNRRYHTLISTSKNGRYHALVLTSKNRRHHTLVLTSEYTTSTSCIVYNSILWCTKNGLQVDQVNKTNDKRISTVTQNEFLQTCRSLYHMHLVVQVWPNYSMYTCNSHNYCNWSQTRQCCILETVLRPYHSSSSSYATINQKTKMPSSRAVI